MSEKTNRQAYLQIIEAISMNRPQELDRYISADILDHNPIPDQADGSPGFKEWVSMARSAFPDLHATVEDVLVSADKVVGRITGYGTEQGLFAGVEPTGKQIAFSAIHIVRFEDGKAVVWWGIADLLGAMQQLQK
jgi:predicted ester cyclase